MNAATIGREMAKRRRAAGLTQAELASRMGTTQSAIARAESDWKTTPRLDFLDRFARATGRPWRITLGASERPADELSRRARRALGRFEFDPWRRSPSDAEARSLLKDEMRSEPGSRQSSAQQRRTRT